WLRNVRLHLVVDQRHPLDGEQGMPEVVNGGQPRVAALDRVEEQVVQDAPSTVPAIVATVALSTDAVMRLLNVLVAL
ncbi:hypothetical protein HAX54_006739, partial [Datura stramonium]|nr:hypothetical protein [Datura stramonium]